MTAQQTKLVVMYCDPCGDEHGFHLAQQEQTLEVRGERITINVPVWRCAECGAVQPYIEGNVDAIKLANDEYRRRHNLLTGEEIKAIREQYCLSREAFAAVLGMSPATLYRYEAGAIQDDLHDSLIAACKDPGTMQELVTRRQDRLTPLQRKRFDEGVAVACLKRRRAELASHAKAWVEVTGQSVACELLREHNAKKEPWVCEQSPERIGMLLPLAELIWHEQREPLLFLAFQRAADLTGNNPFGEVAGRTSPMQQKIVSQWLGVYAQEVLTAPKSDPGRARLLSRLSRIVHGLDNDELKHYVIQNVTKRLETLCTSESIVPHVCKSTTPGHH
jgi:putative zinc finger/helix-turn-helix YgiT family protein